MDRAKQLYPSSSECMVVLFDHRCPGVADRFRSEWEAWGEDADNLEYLDANHVILTIRPGGARRLAR